VLRKDGSFWLILGDTYLNRNLCGIPWKVTLALQDDGWTIRNAVIWNKIKGRPDSDVDKLENTYEYIFHLVLSQRYYYVLDDAKPPSIGSKPSSRITTTSTGEGRFEHENLARGKGALAKERRGAKPGDVWSVSPRYEWRKGFPYSVFPVRLCELPILATCPPDGIVLDPFVGTGTTIVAALKLGRRGVGIDVSADFIEMAERCISSAER